MPSPSPTSRTRAAGRARVFPSAEAAIEARVSATGIDPRAARALVPLAEGALRNVAAQGTTAGLTGPVRRAGCVRGPLRLGTGRAR